MKTTIDRFKSLALVLSLLTIAVARPAAAQQRLSDTSFTLREAVVRARDRAPSVLAAIAQQRAADAQVQIARAPLLPTITGSTSANTSLSNGSFVSTAGVSGSGVTAGWIDTSIVIRWTLWDFGRTASMITAATAQASVASHEARSIERIAESQAAAAYFTLLADRQVVSAAEATVQQRESELSIAQRLVAAGANAPIDQTRAQVALSAARVDLSVAQAAVRNDAAGLAAALALDPTTIVGATAPRELAVDDNPDHAAHTAQVARPEIAAAQARLDAADAQTHAARAGYLPSLSATASASIRYTDRASDNYGTLSELGSAGIVLSVPIFDPGVTANVRAADAMAAAQRASLAQQLLDARTEAVQSALGVQSARETLHQMQDYATVAAANMQQAERRYASGAAPMLELVDAQGADAGARVGVIRAQLQFELAKVRLLAATGQLGALEETG